MTKKVLVKITDDISLRTPKMKDRSFLYDVVSSSAITHCIQTGGDIKKLKPLLDVQFKSQCTEYASRFPQAEDFIIIYKKQRVGRIYINRTSDEIRVLDLTILPDHQNHGIGTALFMYLIKEATQTNTVLRVSIVKQHRSIRLAHRLGFKNQGMTGEMHQLFEWKSDGKSV